MPAETTDQEQQAKRRKDITYFLLAEGEEETQDSCTMFNEWCQQEGVYMPKCEFPAHFEHGLRGVKCIEDIQHREAYLYVPYKMIMNVHKTSQHEVLGPIIEENPDCFDDYCQTFCDQMILTLRVLYEMTLGKKSYWYPYIRQLDMEEVDLTRRWSEQELEMAQDDEVRKEIERYE